MLLLLETSLSQLLDRTIRAFPKARKRQHATQELSLVDIDLQPQKDKLLTKSQVRSHRGRIYDVIIQFIGVKYNPPEGGVSFIDNETTYTIQAINRQQTTCKVRCNCLDFRYRFAIHNRADSSLYGRAPRAYQPKPGSKRGPVNPTKSPGVCKHIIAVMDELEAAQLFE